MASSAEYDDIVVGSGISGLAAALFLARQGHRVLLLEKASRPGGALQQFYRKGVRFDSGFHFTAGLNSDGGFQQALKILGLQDEVDAEFFCPERTTRIVFEEQGEVIELPVNAGAYKAKLKEWFQGESSAIDRYFALAKQVCEQSSAMDFRRGFQTDRMFLDEDYVTLKDVLDGLTGSEQLKTILGCYSLCYGVRPSRISFAAHARMTYALYTSIARIRGGSEELLNAFLRNLERLNVEINCNCTLQEVPQVERRMSNRFLLTDGRIVRAERCLLAIHPQSILEMMPTATVSKAFENRVRSFKSSGGFFAIFGTMPAGAEDELCPIELFCPGEYMEAMFRRNQAGHAALILLRHKEGDVCALNAYEVSQLEDVEQWGACGKRKQSVGYMAYKQERTASILERIARQYPRYAEGLTVLDTASQLTCRDYLNSPDGSAYGIEQRVGQLNLFGRLPVRNMYALGQSSVLPGALGALTSALLVSRGIIGGEQFDGYVKEQLQC